MNRAKTIDPRNLPNCIKKSEVPETPDSDREVNYPTELDEDLYCFRQLTKDPSQIPEGERRYACMILAGHLRDEGVPKTVAKPYLKNFWSQLKQPPKASSKRSWSDVKRIIEDYYDKSKDYRVGCKTVNRHLPDYCDPEKCPIGDRLKTGEEGEASERKTEVEETVTGNEGDREVLKTLSLDKLGQVKIEISDLYQRSNATRGSLHFSINDEHQFEEDRKLSNQNFKQFINDISELYDLEDQEENRLFRGFASLKEEARKEAAKETAGLENKDLEKEKLNVDEDEVYKYLENEPLVKLCEKTDEVHKSDSAQKILARISGYSRSLLDFPINLWPVGSSGSGKTHLLETISRTIPNEYILKFDSCSPKSMYYFCREYGEDALDGKITFFNEVEASEEAKELLRGLTDPAKEKNRLLSVEEQQMLEINIDGLPVSWFTSVDPLDDEQLKNRFLLCNPEEAENHKEEVAKFQKKNIQKGILQPIKLFDFPVLKAAFRKVVNGTSDKKVIIPFDWKWHYEEDSRLQPFFGAILMTSAKIHHRQRPQTEDMIIATLEDYYITKLIFSSVIEQTVAGVKEKDMEIYDAVPESKSMAAKRSEIAGDVGVSTSTARYALDRLTDADLVNSTQEDSGNRAYLYWKTEDEPAQVAIELVQTCLESEEIKKKLEEVLEVCTDIGYIEGVGLSGFDYSDITHFTPSYIRNLIQTLGIERKNAEKLLEDFKPCMENFATYTGFYPEKRTEYKEVKSQLQDRLAYSPEKMAEELDLSIDKAKAILEELYEEGFVKKRPGQENEKTHYHILDGVGD